MPVVAVYHAVNEIESARTAGRTMSPNPPSDGRSDRPEDLRRDGVVHDVNQMLSVIVGRAGFLRERATDEDQRSDLAGIMQAARDAAVILRRLSGPTPASSCCLRDCVVGALSVIQPPGAAGWVAPGPAEPGAWQADNRVAPELGAQVPASEVREVLGNLLLNALAAMPGGGGIRLTAEVAGDRVRLTVSDSGPGLPPDAAGRIFEAGYSTSGEDGRGVGLASSRQLLEDRGGRLDLVSADPGRGATFVLDLPVGQPVPRTAAPETTVPALSVLVVDDEPTVAEMLGDVLGAWGCRVDLAADAAAAEELFVAGRYELALVDWNLPGRSGLDLAEQLREADPVVSIVLMTGLDRESELADAVGTDADDTLVKPLELDALRRVLLESADLVAARSGATTDKEER